MERKELFLQALNVNASNVVILSDSRFRVVDIHEHNGETRTSVVAEYQVWADAEAQSFGYAVGQPTSDPAYKIYRII